MASGKRFLLDTNVFIDAKNRYYKFSICPGFWQAIVRSHERRHTFSIEQVKRELTDKDDELHQWVRDVVPSSFFKKTADKVVIEVYGEIMNWVQTKTQFSDAAKAEFATVADGWLIAYAKANDLSVVTHERFAPDVVRKVLIPNICQQFDVEYLDPFEMLELLNAKFVLRLKKRKPPE